MYEKLLNTLKNGLVRLVLQQRGNIIDRDNAGKDLRVVSEIFTPRRLIETINKELRTNIVLKEVDRATFEAARQYPNAEELWTK